MRTSAFCFAGDLADEGVATVLDNIQHRAGLGGVTMAAAYHASRDLFPHARTRRLRYQPGGEIFFRPDPARWRGLALQPRPSRLIGDGDPLGELVAAADARGLDRAGVDRLPARRLDGGRRSALRRADVLRRSLPDRALPGQSGRARLCARARAAISPGAASRPCSPSRCTTTRSSMARTTSATSSSSAPWRGCCSGCASAHTAWTAPRDTAPTPRSCARGPAPRSSARSRERRAADVVGALARRGRGAARRSARCVARVALRGRRDARRRARRGHARAAARGSSCSTARARSRATRPAGRKGDPAPSIAWRLGVDIAACARAGAAIGAIAYAADPARVALDLASYRALAPACAPGRRAAAGTARLRLRREPRGQAARARARRASTASTSTTTAWRR